MKATAPGAVQVENRCDIRVTKARCCAGFTQKTQPRRFITEVSLIDDFQCHRAAQIDVARLVSDAHRTATQLDRFPIFARDQLVVLKSLQWLLSSRLERILKLCI